MKGFGSCWKINVPIDNTSLPDDADDSSPFTSLPDAIILQLLNKVMDLKTLCFCYVVSKRFSSLILQVNAVSFTAPLLKSPDKNLFTDVAGDGFPRKLFRRLIKGVGFKPLFLRRKIVDPIKPFHPCMSFVSSFACKSFLSALRSMGKLKGVMSLRLELPNSRHKRIDNGLFKWKVNFGSRIESLFFLSPDSISETGEFHVNGNGDEGDMELSNDLLEQLVQKVHNAFQCLNDVIVRHVLLWLFAKNLPMLEEVSITESGRRGRVCMSGEKLDAVKKEAVSGEYDMQPPTRMKYCYVPVLNLPVSRYVMKGVTLIVIEMKGFQVGNGNDCLMKSEDGFEDKEQALYTEALMEILEKHKDRTKLETLV